MKKPSRNLNESRISLLLQTPRVRELLPKDSAAIIAAYTAGCQIDDSIDQLFERSTFSARKIRFSHGSLSDQFKSFFVEPVSYTNERIVSIERLAISRNFGRPDIQKCQQIGLATFLSKIIGVSSVLGFSVGSEEMARIATEAPLTKSMIVEDVLHGISPFMWVA